MRKLMLLFLSVVGCCISGCTISSRVLSHQMKDAVESLPQHWKDEPVVIISDTTRLDLVCEKGGNRLIETSSIVYFVQKRNPDLLQPVYVKFNESYEKPVRIRCDVLYPDGSTWSTSGANLPSYPVPTYYGYTSNQYFKEIVLPRYMTGMYLKVTRVRTYFKPEFFSFEMVGRGMPVVDRCIVFSVPAESDVTYKFMNGEHLDVEQKKTTDSKRRVVSYAFRNLEKVENVDYYSRPGEWFAALYVSLPPEGLKSYSWKKLGAYYLDQIRGAYTGTGQLPGFTEALRSSASPDTLINDILQLLREKVRYHGDFDGIHAVIPHSIGSIISNGYGDCKDMAILSQAIARTHGVSLNLVLLNAGDGFEALPDVPALGRFNHMVIAYKKPDGTVLIADPTSTHGEPLKTGYFYVGRRALILEEQGSYSDTLPRPEGFYNTITTHSKVSYNKSDRRWELGGDIALCGLTAMKLFPDFNELTTQEQAPVLRTYLRKFFELDVQNASFLRLSSDTITVRFTSSFQENFIGLLKGGFVLNKPSLYGGDVRFTTLDFYGPRYYSEIVQKDTWALPSRYSDLEMVELESEIATGRWLAGKKRVQRLFSQNAVRIARKDARTMLVQKNRFLNAKVWKK